MEILRNDVNDLCFPMKKEMKTRSLNPEAQEFFPTRNAILFSDVNSPFFPLTNPHLLPYPTTLPCLHPLYFSRFPHPLNPYFPHPHAAVTETVSAVPPPVTEPVSSLPTVVHEPPTVVAQKKNTGGARTRRPYKSYGRTKPSRHHSTVYNTNFGRARCNNNRKKHPLIPLKDDGNETTVMIRNIPNRYTRDMLKDFLDQHCMIMNREHSHNGGTADEEPSFSAFDFLYLPIDFYTKSNKGYAFVNFANPRAARRFFDSCHNKHWDCFHSTKIREIYCAKLQGMEQLMKHFAGMGFPSVDYQPLSFNPARDGSNQSVQETLVGRCTGLIPKPNQTKPNLIT